MGLLDGALGDLAGSLLGKQAGGVEQLLGGLLGTSAPGGGSSSALLTMAMTLVQQHGGLGGIVQTLQSGGLGDVVSSWVGTGANQAVLPTQLEQALGGSAVAQAQAMSGLAALLPDLIDRLTPEGTVTSGSQAMLTQVMGLLKTR